MSTSNRIELPCGCWRAFVTRMVPAFEEPRIVDGAIVSAPILDEAGGFVMTPHEDVEEGYCEEHSKVVIERQAAAQAAIAAGDTEGAMALMQGVSPFAVLDEGGPLPSLPAHSDTKDGNGNE